jgi:hypothetical protein
LGQHEECRAIIRESTCGEESVVGPLGAVGVEAEGELFELLEPAGPVPPDCDGIEEVLDVLGRGDWAHGQGDGAYGGELDCEVDEHLRVVPPHLDLEGLDRLLCAVWFLPEGVYALPSLSLSSDDEVTPPDCAREGDAVSQGAGKAEGGVLELVWVELKEHMVPQLGWQSQRRHPTYKVEVNSASRLTFALPVPDTAV